MRSRLITRFLLLSALSGSLHAAPSTATGNAVTPPESPTTPATPVASTTPTAPTAPTAPTEVSGPAKAALEAFQAGNFAKAVELATPLAEQGNADALFLLGIVHETGQGAEASKEKAMDYYNKAAAGKNKGAIERLSNILLSSGKEEDRAQACQLLESAAKDDPTVAVGVGQLYLAGKLTPKPDAEKALACWKRAADANNVTAMLLLAGFYEGKYGFADSKDLKLSLEFFTKAAKAGNTEAMVNLGFRLLNGDEKFRDEAKGREWLKKAIDAKEYAAYLTLGDYEENVKKDLKAALADYERGKDAGQLDCMLRAADFYLEGKGVEKDNDRGQSLVTKAAEAGNPEANFRLALQAKAAEKPDKPDKPNPTAIYYGYLIKAAVGNHTEAQNKLAELYLTGGLGAADVPSGVAWLDRAVQGGNIHAQFNLATLFERGIGVPKNPDKAFQLYVAAFKQGHGPATLAVARFLNDGIGIKADPIKAWAVASLAVERGEKDAEKVVKEIASNLDDKQRAEAAKELETIKSGKPANPEDVKKPDSKKSDSKPTSSKDKPLKIK